MTALEPWRARVTHEPVKDVNYVIPRFVIDHLPIGLAGLFIAAVIAAAMNAISGELNSLSTTTTIDFYRRWIRQDAPDAHFLMVSRIATGLWGIFACIVATYAVNLGSLIEVVNKYGSFFYGSILGVFLLAMVPRAKANAAFIGLLVGMTAVYSVWHWAPRGLLPLVQRGWSDDGVHRRRSAEFLRRRPPFGERPFARSSRAQQGIGSRRTVNRGS